MILKFAEKCFKDYSTIDSHLLLIPQINVCVITLFYIYFKPQILPYIYGQFIVSLILTGVYIYFAAKIFPLIHNQSGSLLQVVESINIITAVLLLAEAVCAFIVGNAKKAHEEEEIATSRAARDAARNTGENVTVPPIIHIYQPNLDLTSPSAEASPQNRTSVISGSNGAGEVRLDVADDYELDELPKYQRKPPAQSATIIDMANLASVNPAVLENVVRPLSSMSSSSSSDAQTSNAMQDVQREGHEPNQDNDVPTTDAPEYTPRPATPTPDTSNSTLPSTSSPASLVRQGTMSEPPVYMP
ncbi:hypothetical protein FBU30_001742 [Linnemannia zychae]|nr:hypothetical protein FBU30_001742 [Linnemannia zychae]